MRVRIVVRTFNVYRNTAWSVDERGNPNRTPYDIVYRKRFRWWKQDLDISIVTLMMEKTMIFSVSSLVIKTRII